MLVTVPVGFSRELTERLSAGVSVGSGAVDAASNPSALQRSCDGWQHDALYLSAGNQAPAFGAGFNAGVHYSFRAVAVGSPITLLSGFSNSTGIART